MPRNKTLRPFMGVDGEGAGENRHGQQNYKLLRAGPYELLAKRARLTTLDCLEFICGLPPEPLLVGFAFGYDATQILRDLPPNRLERLFADKEAGNGHSRYTYFGDYAVEYLPKNYLRVCRTKPGRIKIMGRWLTTRTRIEGSARTIYDAFGFFQMSFLKALQAFEIGKPHWAAIERNKADRDKFERMTKEIRRYCELECELLAELMEKFRALCHANDLRPNTWNGSGKLAAAEHRTHGTITAEQIAELVPSGVLQMAADAYYGGRFEITRTGEIAGPVYEYDICSAYPSAMRVLPCLLHGTWEPFTGKPPPKSLHVAYVAFWHPPSAPICGLPIRQKDGRLFWPRKGQGIYWSPELNAARTLGARLRYTGGWRYVCNCECQPFDWIEHRYKQRLALGRDNMQGTPLKLALNSLYGKLAQRIGQPRYANLIWAGLITALTRASLNAAAATAAEDVLMFATDAVFSRVPLAVPIGEALGDWEAKQHPRLFIVQPGIYWGASRPKTRGVPASLFTRETGKFERAWKLYCGTYGDASGPPVVGFPLKLFTGLRLAHARGAPDTAGRWSREFHEWSFDWARKRAVEPVWETPLCARSRPAAGAADLVSVPHSGNKAASYLLDQERMMFDEQADHVDLTPP